MVFALTQKVAVTCKQLLLHSVQALFVRLLRFEGGVK